MIGDASGEIKIEIDGRLEGAALEAFVRAGGGLLVAEFITAGTVTPVAAAQAQLELTYVAKKIASLGSKLHLLYSDITKVLDAFRGLKGIEAMRFVFDVAPAAGSLL